MVALKVKNGRWHPDILVIGKITARKVLEYSFTKTETSTKECGQVIRDTGKGHIGEMKVANSGESTLVTGMKTGNTEEVHSSIKMETDMMVTGLMVNHKVKVE